MDDLSSRPGSSELGTTTQTRTLRDSDNLTRFLTLLTGYTFKKFEEIIFDNIVYGAVVWGCLYLFGVGWGGLIGFLIMGSFSALLCWGYVWIYDHLKRDWFGFESLKEMKEEMNGGGAIRRLIQRFVRRGDWAAFLALSVVADPFMTTIYLRKGHYEGLTQRDKFIFSSSVIVSNAYWTLRWVAVGEIVLGLYGLLPSSIQQKVQLATQLILNVLN